MMESTDALHDDSSLTSHKDLDGLSFLEIQELRNKLGIKKFNKKFGKSKATSQSADSSRPVKKKRVKHAPPLEMSSKRPVNPFPSSAVKKAVTRDPRFDDLSGHYDEQLFKRSYKFIDRLKAKEIKAVKKIAEDEEMDEATRKRAKDMLTRMKQKKAAKKTISAESKVDKALKEERKAAIKEGHTPYFVKSGERKKLVLAEQYKELKEKGQLESFMKKKRKQNAKKNSTLMPSGR